jgi:DNA-binding XRE family transcriptional regulator
MTISEKIYRCRKANGRSQEELAALLGVSRQSVSKWETGDALPEISKLLPMARSFGVTTDWLLDEEAEYPYQPPTPPVSAGNGDAAVKKTGMLYRKYGWIIGAVMLVYGLLLSVGTIPFFYGICQSVKNAPEEAAGMFRVLTLIPGIAWGISAALIVGGIVFLIRFRKKNRDTKKKRSEQ